MKFVDRFSLPRSCTFGLIAVLVAGSQARATSAAQSASAQQDARVGNSTLATDTQSITAPACQPDWIPEFFGAPGVNGEIDAMVVFDDGSGPALYAGGDFTRAGGAYANRIAKWDGSRWSRLDVGMESMVDALAVFDDGGGPALYAGGRFGTAGGVTASHIAKWNGSTWSALGSGASGDVLALHVFDDGSGPALYAGGTFTSIDGVSANHVAKWNGTSWSALGSGTDSWVYALTTFDDGSGPALFVGGAFVSAGGVGANKIAKWDGSSWYRLGSGASNTVEALQVFDDGTGPALFATGLFVTAGGVVVNGIAKWSGSSWSALGTGLYNDGSTVTGRSLAVFGGGSGPALYVGGVFSHAGGAAAHFIGRWNGTSWTGLGLGTSGSVNALATFDDGSGAALFTAGTFTLAGGKTVNRIARWTGSNWSMVGKGLSDSVRALATFDDGSGPAVFAGGDFNYVANVQLHFIAKWNGTSWVGVGGGMNNGIYCLSVFDDGSGEALYVGGDFTGAGTLPVSRVARWDGTSWSDVGGGVNGDVYSMTAFDDGSGPALYVGGYFSSAGGVGANNIAKWNGSSWSALGTGVNVFGPVGAFAVFDDGSGPALFVGGAFTDAGGSPVNGIAKWDGSSWSALNGGVGGTYPSVSALSAFDDGTGSALFAGGIFTSAGGVPANHIARWNGATWSALGNGVTGGNQPFVDALTVFDDGNAESLYAGGIFLNAGSSAVNNVARWNGSGWSSVGTGTTDRVTAFTISDGMLCVGGLFTSAPQSGDSYVAKWGAQPGCGNPGSSRCEPGAGGVIACPCGNAAATSGVGCNNSSNTGGAQLTATGIARLSFDTVVFTTSGEKPTATSIVLQGTSASSLGSVFGQGVRCVGGTLKRLYTKTASGGSITAPQGTDLEVHARSAQLGDTIAPGTHRYYGVYYRDPTVLGSCPAGSTFNITQQLDVLWSM